MRVSTFIERRVEVDESDHIRASNSSLQGKMSIFYEHKISGDIQSSTQTRSC